MASNSPIKKPIDSMKKHDGEDYRACTYLGSQHENASVKQDYKKPIAFSKKPVTERITGLQPS